MVDKSLFLSDGQAITATAVSDNVLDLLATNWGHGKAIPLAMRVVVPFGTGADTVRIDLKTHTLPTVSAGVTIASTYTVPAADLVAGYQLGLTKIPDGADFSRFLGLVYNVGTSGEQTGFEAGAIDAYLTNDLQTNKALEP